MPIHVDRAAGIATIILAGEPEWRDVAAAFDRVLGDVDFEPGMGTLWDLRDASMHALSGADVRRIVAHAGRHRERRGRGRVALVVERDIDFGMARMFELFAAEQLPTPVMVFRNVGDARRWLAHPPDQPR